MSARPTACLLAALVLATAATGCGSGDDGASAQTADDASRVEALVERVQRAVADGDSRSVCANLTEAARAAAIVRASGQEGAGTCERSFDMIAAAHVDGEPLPRVADVAVDGDRARVTLEQPDGGELRLTAYRQGEDWKLRLLVPGDTRPTDNPDFRPPVPEGQK